MQIMLQLLAYIQFLSTVCWSGLECHRFRKQKPVSISEIGLTLIANGTNKTHRKPFCCSNLPTNQTCASSASLCVGTLLNSSS